MATAREPGLGAISTGAKSPVFHRRVRTLPGQVRYLPVPRGWPESRKTRESFELSRDIYRDTLILRVQILLPSTCSR